MEHVKSRDGKPVSVRIGVHSGQVVAGVMGGLSKYNIQLATWHVEWTFMISFFFCTYDILADGFQLKL